MISNARRVDRKYSLERTRIARAAPKHRRKLEDHVDRSAAFLCTGLIVIAWANCIRGLVAA